MFERLLHVPDAYKEIRKKKGTRNISPASFGMGVHERFLVGNNLRAASNALLRVDDY